MNLIENLLTYSWPEELGSIKTPFKLMEYEDAMELYGTDQPDLRIPYQVRINNTMQKNTNAIFIIS